jgi:hypothetical protein
MVANEEQAEMLEGLGVRAETVFMGVFVLGLVIMGCEYYYFWRRSLGVS